MATTQDFATLSENESVVRTYACTRVRNLFAKTSIGYLTITNKRVVYHNESKAFASTNQIISEIPLNDVGSISANIGSSFNILYFLLFSAAVYMASSLLTDILPEFFTSWAVTIILIVPYLIGLLFEKNILNKEIGNKVIKNLEGTNIDTLFKNKNPAVYMKVFRIMFLTGLVLFAWNIAHSTSLADNGVIFGYIFMFVAYFILFAVFIGRMRSFGLMISSKTSTGSGILIPGSSFFLLSKNSNVAAHMMNTLPGDEADSVAKELGALVLDIQQMGDLGIAKWSRVALQ